MIFERIFWKIGTALAQGCFCKEIWNTVLLRLFYWQPPQHFMEEFCSPIAHVKHQADNLGRLTLPQASMGRASSTNLALQPNKSCWCLSSNFCRWKIFLTFASFLVSARVLWTYCESLIFLSEVFSLGKITWVTTCAVNYITHCSLLILFIIFYSTIQRKTKLNSATSPHTSIHLQSMFLISRHKCGTTEP